MGGSSSGVSKADLDSLKSQMTKVKSDVTKLQTDSTDPSARIAKTIDYKSLADKIMEIDSYKEGLASKIADNPGKLGDELGEKLGASNTIKTSLGIALEGNTKFAETLAGVLTDTSKTYYKNIRGAKGEAGSLSGSKDVLKANLHDPGYTMWCADGEMCNLPPNKKGIKVDKIQIGNWFLEPHGGPNGNLHFHRGDVNDWFLSVETNKDTAFRGNIHPNGGHVNGRHIVNDMNNLYNFADNIGVRRDRHYSLVARGGRLQAHDGCHNHDGCKGHFIPTWHKDAGKGEWEKISFDQY